MLLAVSAIDATAPIEHDLPTETRSKKSDPALKILRAVNVVGRPTEINEYMISLANSFVRSAILSLPFSILFMNSSVCFLRKSSIQMIFLHHHSLPGNSFFVIVYV